MSVNGSNHHCYSLSVTSRAGKFGIFLPSYGHGQDPVLRSAEQLIRDRLSGLSFLLDSMKEYAAAFYASAAWKKARRTYIAHRIEVDGGLCEECHEALGYIVHHIQELTPENINDISVTLDHSNLQYVCKDCHDRFENHWIGPGRPREIKKFYFDSDGEPVPRLPP